MFGSTTILIHIIFSGRLEGDGFSSSEKGFVIVDDRREQLRIVLRRARTSCATHGIRTSGR